MLILGEKKFPTEIKHKVRILKLAIYRGSKFFNAFNADNLCYFT